LEYKLVLKSVPENASSADRRVLVDIRGVKRKLGIGLGNIMLKRCRYDDANKNGMLDVGEKLLSEEVLVERGSMFIANKISEWLNF